MNEKTLLAQHPTTPAIDVESMLRDTVPGGSICDPQQVADAIREWFAKEQPATDNGQGLPDNRTDADRRSDESYMRGWHACAASRATDSPPQQERAAVPDGWVLVPRVATQAMIDAGVRAGVNASPAPWCPDTYRAMLAAAPAAPVSGHGAALPATPESAEPVATFSQFFSYDPQGDFITDHPTAQAARDAAEASVEFYRDEAPDGWNEEVLNVCWGAVLGEVQETERRPITREDREELGISQSCAEYVDYRLVDIATPPTEQAKPSELESRESRMVIVDRAPDGTPTVWCDPEIADLVTALNTGRLTTVASCSGHGHRPGRISLADGRELFVLGTYEEAAALDRLFPVGINGETVAAPAQVTDSLPGTQRWSLDDVLLAMRSQGGMAQGFVPGTDCVFTDADALVSYLDTLMDDGGQGGEKWGPAQAAIAGIRAGGYSHAR